MQSAAAKSSSSRKAYEKRYRVGDQDQGNFSIDLWKELSRMHVKGFALFELEGMSAAACL